LGIHNCIEKRTPGAHCLGAAEEERLRSRSQAPLESIPMKKFPSRMVSVPESGEPIFQGIAIYPARVIIGPGMYQLGIIDILQEWDLNKKCEQILKRLFRGHCLDYVGLSAVEPKYYCTRFKNAILDKVFDVDETLDVLEAEAKRDYNRIVEEKMNRSRDNSKQNGYTDDHSGRIDLSVVGENGDKDSKHDDGDPSAHGDSVDG